MLVPSYNFIDTLPPKNKCETKRRKRQSVSGRNAKKKVALTLKTPFYCLTYLKMTNAAEKRKMK